MNYFLEALKKYAIFMGRARRSEYWYFTLFSIIISVVLTVIGTTVNFPMLPNIYSIAVLVPSIAVGVRRMHDVEKSGWFLLIPLYNLYLLSIKGTTGPNEYGEDPKGGAVFGENDYERPLDVTIDN